MSSGPERYAAAATALGIAVGIAVHAAWEWRRERRQPRSVARERSGPSLDRAVGYARLRQKEAELQQVQDSPLLRMIFDDLAGEDRLLSEEEFTTALTQRLKLDLSPDELSRVWRRIIEDEAPEVGAAAERRPRTLSSKHTGAEELITFETFRRGVANVAFLRHMVSQLTCMPNAVDVHAGYDYTKPTNGNYAADGLAFFGKYADIREGRDYSYHVNYMPARQAWQHLHLLYGA